MRRFLLGIVTGAALTALAAAGLWPAGSQRLPGGESGAHEAAGPSGARRADRERMVAPSGSGGGDAAVGTVPVDPSPPSENIVARIRDAIAARQEAQVNQLVLWMKQDPSQRPAPGDILADLARWCTQAGANSGPRYALANFLEMTPPKDVEALLREIASAPAGSSPIEGVLDELVASLARGAGAPGDLAESLVASGEPARIRAGVALAALVRPPDAALIARVLDGEGDEQLHTVAMSSLVEVARRDGATPRCRELAGMAAVRAFETCAPRAVREAALPALVLGGDRGLAIAERVAVEGGLDAERRVRLFDGLVEHGRLAQLMQHTEHDPRLLVLVAHGVFDMYPPREADVVTLWPRLPEILAATDEDTEVYPADSAADLGRFDLVEEMALDERLSACDRVAALSVLLEDDESDVAAHALDVAEGLAFSAGAPTGLRRRIVDALWRCWDVGDGAHVQRVLSVARRIAREDGNEWVRGDAEVLVSYIEDHATSR